MTRFRYQNEPQAPGRLVRKNLYGVIYEDRSISKPDALSRHIYDEVIPNFHKRKAQGEIFNNSYSSSRSTFSSTGTYFGTTTRKSGPDAGKSDSHEWSNGALLTELYKNGSIPFPTVSLDTVSATATAAIDAIGSVNKTDFDLGTFAGEWSKTRTLHRDLGNAMLKLVKEGAKRRYKNAASFYLAARYGLLPLLSDLEGACKMLSKSYSPRQTARSTQTLSGVADSVMNVGDRFGIVWPISLQTTRSWTTRHGILYESSVAGRMVASLGLSRPLSTAWELLPWSFVADWFLNVGAWLDAVQPSLASRNLCAWVSTNETIVRTAIVGAAFSGSDSDFTGNFSWSGQLVSTSIVKTRTPWSPTVPTSPSFGTGFNAIRSFDFAALVLQRIKIK